MPALYIVRHAHAKWTSNEDRPLSDKGNRDAPRVADILSAYSISIIYSGPFRRACQAIAPLAESLRLTIRTEPDLRERKLGEEAFEDFFKAVEATWQNPSFAHPGGESSVNAQSPEIAVVQRLLEQHPSGHFVLSTHWNLIALILQAFDPSVDFMFWKSLTMPDIYKLDISQSGNRLAQRLCKEFVA